MPESWEDREKLKGSRSVRTAGGRRGSEASDTDGSILFCPSEPRLTLKDWKFVFATKGTLSTTKRHMSKQLLPVFSVQSPALTVVQLEIEHRWSAATPPSFSLVVALFSSRSSCFSRRHLSETCFRVTLSITYRGGTSQHLGML